MWIRREPFLASWDCWLINCTLFSPVGNLSFISERLNRRRKAEKLRYINGAYGFELERILSCRLWHWTSICTLLFEGPINLVAPYDNSITNQIKVRSFPKAQGSLCNTVCVFGCMVFDQYCICHIFVIDHLIIYLFALIIFYGIKSFFYLEVYASWGLKHWFSIQLILNTSC